MYNLNGKICYTVHYQTCVTSISDWTKNDYCYMYSYITQYQ